jgi:hypothetical protein
VLKMAKKKKKKKKLLYSSNAVSTVDLRLINCTAYGKIERHIIKANPLSKHTGISPLLAQGLSLSHLDRRLEDKNQARPTNQARRRRRGKRRR